ncbi:MAG TPA: biotin synthase BioB [Syntrophorhabdaceae bacterium]|nr:biotin synthase BioB [Syntrophorhabdaceae bacterium]HPU30673.1 biotin synthase BioB [Syntrophorhabdaceae bacterium]
MDYELERLKEKAIADRNIEPEDAITLYRIGLERPFMLFAYASEITQFYKGKKISFCSIINAKSGLCPEDCKFCAQSSHYNTDAEIYPLLSNKTIVERAAQAKEQGAHMFGIVTSGTEIDSDEEWKTIEESVKEINHIGIKPCGSLGMLDKKRAEKLKKAGLFRYHHNLETARSYFSHICTTHDYDEDIETIKNAKEAGLSTCCGGIIGLGETMEQRIELAFTIKELDVDSVPINILNPIKGTPLEHQRPLSPMEVLITLSIFRFIMPDKDIKVCGGKEKNLRQLLPLAILAGCNSLMTGNYLTTPGRNAQSDMEMVMDLGFYPGI